MVYRGASRPVFTLLCVETYKPQWRNGAEGLSRRKVQGAEKKKYVTPYSRPGFGRGYAHLLNASARSPSDINGSIPPLILK